MVLPPTSTTRWPTTSAGRAACGVHRTLQLIVSAVRATLLSEQRAQALVNSLADSDARFPQAARQDLFAWAQSQHPPLL